MIGQGRPNLRTIQGRLLRAMLVCLAAISCRSRSALSSALLLPFFFRSDRSRQRLGSIEANGLKLPLILVFLLAGYLAASPPIAAVCPQFPTREPGESDESAESMRIRLSWGGGQEQAWEVIARLDQGHFLDPQLLGLTPETPGSAALSGNELRIIQPQPCNYGGVDVTLTGRGAERLVLDFIPAGDPTQRVARTIVLTDLRSGTITEPLDENQNQFSVARVPGDWLRVEPGRDVLIFEPGERWQLGLAPHLYPGEATSVRCTGKLVPARSLTPVLQTRTWDWELDSYGNAPSDSWDLELPQREGVYDLIFELEPRRYQQVSFANSTKGRLVRRVQLVVLARDNPANPATVDEWKLAGVVDAATASRRDWRRGFANPPTSGFLAHGNPKITAQREIAGRRFLELGPGEWQTFTLPTKALGQPHRLEIDLHDEAELTLGFSLLEADSSGRIQVFGADSGLVRQGSPSADSGSTDSITTQVIEFWPSTAQPLLLVNNRHASSKAAIGQLRVLAGPDRLPEPTVANQADGLPASSTLSRTNYRGRLAFYEFPLFPENFGAEFALDPGTGQLLTDWVTFYQGADRLIQYLRSHHYRGAMIAVVADGSALYPSQLLEATPRFDSGVFFSTGQDPLRKDVLELLLRMFSRAGLELVPIVTLNGRLPGLEQTLRQDSAAGLLLRDPNGRIPESSEEVPRYNPLSPAVQQEVQRVIFELVDRYSHHGAFRGVALTCQAETCTQLPGRRWGLQLEQVNRFLASQQQPPLSSVSDLFAEATQQTLFGPGRDAWLAYRAEQLTSWYQDLERTVRTALPEGKLYLAGVDLYRIGDLPSLLTPSLQWPIDLPTALRDLGWDLAQLDRLGHTVVMRPNRFAPAGSLVSERLELNLAGLEQTRQALSRGNYSAGLFISRAPWSRITAPATESTNGPAEPPLLRWQPLSLAGHEDRQRYAESLAHYDTRVFAEGGWLLPRSSSVDEFFQTLSTLPDEKFEGVQPASRKGLLTVRQCRSVDGWHGYVVNPTPWPVTAELAFGGTPATPLRVTPERLPIEREDESGQFRITCQVEPYGIVAFHSPVDSLSLVDQRSRVEDQVGEALRTRLRRLQEQLVAASTPRAWSVLKNPECNATTAGGESGWRFDTQQSSEVQFSPDPLRPDNSALHLQSTGQTVWVRSNELPVPKTGRLSISAWLRIDPNQPQPPLRIAIEADADSPEYYRYARVGSLAREDAAGESLTPQWKQFVVHFDDLPIHTAERCRIGFDLMGAGDLWIDRVEVFDRWFDQNDTKALTQLLAAAGPLLRDQAGWNECRLLLDSYWLRFLEQFGGPEPVVPDANDPAVVPTSESVSGVSTEEETSTSPFQLRRQRRADKPRMVPFR